MARKRVYEDDDGRTIADMSEIERPGIASVRRSTGESRQEDVGAGLGPFQSKQERRMYILGALRAALLIALVFIAGLGLVILLLLLLWN